MWDSGRWCAEWRLSTDIRRTADEYHLSLRGLLQEAGLRMVERAVVASVVPLLTPVFVRAAGSVAHHPALEVSPPGYGMGVDYDPPESLGADRFVNALAAWHLVHGPVVVVDVGTTATIDAVSADGRFLGGSIAPGPHFLTQALAQGTARLPHIPPVIPDFAIGRRTADAIAAGVGHGFVGMVRELVAWARQVTGESAEVVLTGGWAGRLRPHLGFAARLEPRLTLEGLRVAAEWAAAHDPGWTRD
ncbi:Type III pantothenate kinase [Candidatus Hydrogenisulfobacillus filiaventi]|uniref:Type III pantothenate kinase n=1 Tax=Candidatus Hydrogenisulfobacillus filiaventi TaxID=2707344 RepID=A0A6F8ZJ42_9FIRM|nr:Type III pantothenate kinase [Candidatus Hydrogenisulfobacillus filiaventi]